MVRRALEQPAQRHRAGRFLAHRAVLGQRRARNAHLALLHRVRVGDPPAQEHIARSGNLGQRRAEHAARATLNDRERLVPLAQHAQGRRGGTLVVLAHAQRAEHAAQLRRRPFQPLVRVALRPSRPDAEGQLPRARRHANLGVVRSREQVAALALAQRRRRVALRPTEHTNEFHAQRVGRAQTKPRHDDPLHHRAHLARRAGQAIHIRLRPVAAIHLAPQARRGPERVAQTLAPARPPRLHTVEVVHRATLRAEDRLDLRERVGVLDERIPHRARQPVARHIVRRRAEPARADHQRRRSREPLDRARNALRVIADRRVLDRRGAQRAQPLRQPLAVRVQLLAERQFIADRENRARVVGRAHESAA